MRLTYRRNRQKVQDMAQNLYSDTRGRSERPVTFTEAVIDGLAAGGGLYVPEHIPELSLDEIGALAALPYAQRAARIYEAFDIDLPADTIEALMERAYGDNFDDERICPITSLTANTHVLELWHGPTSAFKDMALQCLPRFFSASAKQLREQGMTIFLVEQNANQALKLADRGYVLENGHVVLSDTGDALLANEAVRSAYLGG